MLKIVFAGKMFEFRNHKYEGHQQSKSVLADLKLGLISQVPLDYMHLVCLGVVKKLIRLWVENGSKNVDKGQPALHYFPTV